MALFFQVRTGLPTQHQLFSCMTSDQFFTLRAVTLKSRWSARTLRSLLIQPFKLPAWARPCYLKTLPYLYCSLVTYFAPECQFFDPQFISTLSALKPAVKKYTPIDRPDTPSFCLSASSTGYSKPVLFWTLDGTKPPSRHPLPEQYPSH
jgi:hypothetical protein